MSWGSYSWGSKSYPCLSHPCRSSNASLVVDSKGGLTAQYTGWYFTLDDGSFNNFMYHEVSAGCTQCKRFILQLFCMHGHVDN
jgi:hypothetical protein